VYNISYVQNVALLVFGINLYLLSCSVEVGILGLG